MDFVKNVQIRKHYHVVGLGHPHVRMVIINLQENVYNV